MKRHVCRIAAMVALAVGAAIRSQEEIVQERKAPINADWDELTASMEKMHAAVTSTHISENSDMNFIQLMLPHHQAAINMARTELKYGKDPQMHRLAQEIVTDQQSEIELMQLWLNEHRPHK